MSTSANGKNGTPKNSEVTSLIFLLSIRYGVGGFSRKDYIAFFAAGLGLLGWYFAKDAAKILS